MSLSNKIIEKIENLQEQADRLEDLVLKLIKAAPLKLYPNLKQYGFGTLPETLQRVQKQAFSEYISWYSSTLQLIKKYLPDQIENFKSNYQTKGRHYEYGVLDIIQLQVGLYDGDRNRVAEKFINSFYIQKSMLLSLKSLELEEHYLPSTLENLEESLVQCIYDYILKTPTSFKMKSRTITQPRKNYVKKRDKFTCQLCQRKFNEDELEIDHIYPFSLGGSNDPKNLMVVCNQCNKRKSSTLDYYRSYEGKLKLQENIRDFVKSLLMITDFGEWLKSSGDRRRKV